MWKLTITQKRKSEFSNSTFDEKVEFTSDDVCYLTAMVDRFSRLEEVFETAYKIDKVEKEVETHRNGVSNAIAVFNDRYFSVRDAIRKIKSKLTTIFNKDNKDDMER